MGGSDDQRQSDLGLSNRATLPDNPLSVTNEVGGDQSEFSRVAYVAGCDGALEEEDRAISRGAISSDLVIRNNPTAV